MGNFKPSFLQGAIWFLRGEYMNTLNIPAKYYEHIANRLVEMTKTHLTKGWAFIGRANVDLVHTPNQAIVSAQKARERHY